MLSIISLTYRLSTSAAEILGADAISTYEAALTATLSKAHPDAEVSVDVRRATADESTFDATCETTDGVEVRAWRGSVGNVEVGADPEALGFAESESIGESFRHADETAWERACEAVEA